MGTAFWKGLDRTELGDNRKLRMAERTLAAVLSAQNGKRSKLVKRLEREVERLQPKAKQEANYAMRKGLR